MSLRILTDDNGHPIDGGFVHINPQKVAYTATAGRIANNLSPDTRLVRIVCSSAAYLAFGNSAVVATPNGTATVAIVNGVYIPANTPEIFALPSGTEKISAVQDTAGGNLHVTEIGVASR